MVREAEPMSIFERRRRAPMHYKLRAENARFVSYVLSERISEALISGLAQSLGYNGSPEIAVGETFRREAALALELSLKAVIAVRLEQGTAPKGIVRIPLTHDLPQLWSKALLPPLPSRYKQVLFVGKTLLEWAGRYGAPSGPKADHKFEIEHVAKMPQGGTLASVPTLDWDGFDYLYRIADAEFERLWKEYR